MLDTLIASTCPDGVLTIDAEGRITAVNNAARDMFGWPVDTLVGQSVSVLVPREQRGKHQCSVREYISGTLSPQKMADWRDIEGQRRDGSRFPLKIWLTSRASDGKHETIAFIRDMSETRRLELALAEDEASLKQEREKNALLALVAEHATDSVIITDAEGLTIWCNPATEKLSGYKAHEFAGRKPGELLQGPDTDPAVVRQIGEAVRAGESIRCELLNYTKAGESYWIEMNVTPIRGAGGEVDKFIAVERNITLAKQQQDALHAASRAAQDAERRLHDAVNALSDGFVIYDADDRLVMCNAALREQLSFLADKLVPGARFADLTREAASAGFFDTQGKTPEQWTREQIEKRASGVEVEAILKFGDGRWMLRRERRTARGEMIGIRTDITELKQQELRLTEALRKAERAEGRLASAIEAISEGFVIYDEYDRLVMANSAYKKMRAEDADMIVPGVTFEELVRTAVERGHFDTEDEDPDEWVRKQVEARRANTSVETMVRFTDGRWMLRRERRTPQGEMIGIRSDVTAFKQHEAALQEARRKAEDADRAKSEFVANISHELRTPINGIMGFNQLMMAGELSDKQRERAEIIKASSQHLLQLVNDLLDLSRIASNGVELDPAPFDVGELAGDVVELMTPLASGNGLRLEVKMQVPAGTHIEGDRSRIKQILLNLIGNAIKFTHEGEVTLHVTEIAGGIAFAVEDTGPGMPQDKLQSIFERFSQLKHERPGIPGAGLGLAITKGLVDLMGGRIDVTSEPGKGSIFTVRLPLPQMPREIKASKRSGCKKKADADERRAKMFDVLVAEDHPFNQVLISEILDSVGCRVTMAENGQEALDHLEKNAFDLIIMDNQMPVMSGLEAIRHIRARADWKTRIPILALTANAMRGAEKEYEAHGVEEFMTKPLDVNRVIEVVKRLGSMGRQVREQAVAAAH